MTDLEKLLCANETKAKYLEGRIETSKSLGSWDTTLENFHVRALLEERDRLLQAVRIAVKHAKAYDYNVAGGRAEAEVLAALRGDEAGT